MRHRCKRRQVSTDARVDGVGNVHVQQGPAQRVPYADAFPSSAGMLVQVTGRRAVQWHVHVGILTHELLSPRVDSTRV